MTEQTRRSFLGGLLAFGTTAVGALLAIPLARFSLDPLWRTTSGVLWSDVGPAADFRSMTAPMKMQVAKRQLKPKWMSYVPLVNIYKNIQKPANFNRYAV